MSGAPVYRRPLANTGLAQVNQPKVAPAAPPKAPSSPPLPRQNAKIVPPSPPRVICSKDRRHEFTRLGFLGEGGFARVYEVKDHQSKRYACKVVTKASLKTKKAKTKLYAEIKIHKFLEHPNIVRFRDCFEDDENVYMTLELCPSGSLMDMLRRRRRFTEPEARFFMVQLIGACNYMHTNQVIHRDLKLGNIFLDANMNVKVGDFGLAALIESPGERKKTICGTPNYIAPEVLFDTANGHSFEVDTWSIGVILYTLVIGKPPFQTKDVKTIYKRIRDNDYEFPADRVVSPEVEQLVRAILTQNPQERPSLYEIVEHDFFVEGIVPSYIPVSAHENEPNWTSITREVSKQNLQRLRRFALLDEDQANTIATPAPPKGPTASVAQQEKEFQKAVQPGSPISALLSSARQPLIKGPPTNRIGSSGETPLFRKLQAASIKSPARGASAARGDLQNIQEGRVEREPAGDAGRTKALEAQKARIVAQMVPGSNLYPREERENHVPAAIVPRKGKERATEVAAAPTAASLKLVGFEAAQHTLQVAFEARSKGKVFRDPRTDVDLPDERVFIVSWVDYCNKYGMGYALTDGSVGVHFNDSTSLVLSPDKQHFDYISSRRSGTAFVRKSFTITEFPDELKNKVYLLKHFEIYIMDKLYGEYDYTFEDTDRDKGMDFVQKYLRMKHVIVFKLSHDVLQFNFYDHSKIILSSHGLLITHIDKHYKMTRWTLSAVMAMSLKPSADPETLKFQTKLVEKLKYCREVLVSIANATHTEGADKQPAAIDFASVAAQMSKASLG